MARMRVSLITVNRSVSWKSCKVHYIFVSGLNYRLYPVFEKALCDVASYFIIELLFVDSFTQFCVELVKC
jgi:hypothetical protein